ncbi:MAG: ribonuclease HII [Candidatus Bathyarchaeia archaeon]
MLVAGVDDAGRGAVIGPLVIAGVLVKEEDLPRLKELGVKDSKLLSPHRREVLAPEIRKIVQKYAVLKLQPEEIDLVVKSGRKLHKLNWLEAQTMARVIETLKPDRVYVDASDVLEERFKQHILECMSFRVDIISEHKADRNYVAVSAASIIAKVERDREVAELARVYGDFGSGYPSDQRTMNFLKQLVERTGEYPEFIRKSWKPAKKVKDGRGSHQTKLA